MSILTNNFYSVKNFKHESCPVCNNNDARCKPSHGDSILCWNTTASEVDEASWFIVADIDAGNSGMRGVMVAPRKNSDDEKEDLEILEYKRQQARQRRSLELAHLPSVESRDKGYREILEAMTLSSKHSFTLKEKRGLSREQVQIAERLLWFKTWEKGIDCSENIAGIDPATEATRWLGGMFISAIDHNGNILGGQIAADNTEVVGKYFWVSSLKVGGYGCNMPYTNSLPLFVRKHPDSAQTSQIWLCEGGLKSAIVALKAWETDINIVVVGTAMSARFSDQLLDILAELKPSDGVRILPDAGTVENLSILSGVLITIEQIKKNGYISQIGWWDQWEKGNSLDIDDYLIAKNGDYTEIVWLTTAQFVSLVTPANLSETIKKNEPAPQSEVLPFEPQMKRRSSEAANDKAYKTYQKYLELDAPDVTKFGNILTSQPKLATDWNALNSDNNTPYEAGWEFYPPRPGEILFLVAGTGEGKSHLLAHWMNEYFIEHGCIFLGYRNGLLHQQRKKVNELVHLRGEDSDGFRRLVDPYYRVAFCDASLHNEDVTGSCTHRKILVLDEVMSILSSLFLGSTCSIKRRKRLNVFTEMLQEADMVICLDAYLANWCVDLLTHLAKKVKRVMQNKWQGQPRKVKMLMGTETNPNDKTAITSDILADAINSKPIAVFSDSKQDLHTLHNMMIKNGVDHRSIARVDSSTSSEKWCIELLENIDLYLENHPEIKVLLVSPSGDSGLDLSRVYFEHVYLILCGTLTIDSALQMYGRVRDRSAPRTVFCAKNAHHNMIDGGLTKAEIQGEMSLSIENQLRLITDGAEDSDDIKSLMLAAVEKWQKKERTDKILDAVSLMLAKANFEKLYYRDLFVERLEKLGDIIEFACEEGDPDIKKKYQETSLEVKYAEADKFVAAEEISEIEAESLRRKDLNPEQVMQLKKFDLQHRIPGVEIDRGLAKTLLYDRDFLKGLEQRYYLSHPEISIEIAQLKWGKSLSKREFFTSDMRSKLAVRTDCLDKLGLLEFLDDREWLENGSEVKILRQRWDNLRKTYSNLRNIMGFEWDKKKPIQTVYKLLDLVGCELRVIKAKSGEQKTGQKVKKRRITFGSLNDPIRLAILESFDKRFENLKEVDWQEVKTVCKNEIELEPELVTA